MRRDAHTVSVHQQETEVTLPVKLRRFLLLQAFLWWQGGFVFYAAVVVPNCTEELGSAMGQGAITQRVTVWLNLLGLMWHALLLWDILADKASRSRRAEVLAASFVGLVALIILHRLMGRFFVDSLIRPADAKVFRTLHVSYLWISTLHWLLGLVALWLTLGVWMGKPGSLERMRND
jgi:hypothetical protein